METVNTYWSVKTYRESADLWSKDAQNDIAISIHYESDLFDDDDLDTLYSILEDALDGFDAKIDDYDYDEDDKKDMRENLKYKVTAILNIQCSSFTRSGIDYTDNRYINL